MKTIWSKGAENVLDSMTRSESGRFENVMHQGLTLADWDGFEARAAASRARGLWRGLGLATFLEWTGGNAFEERVTVTIGADGVVEVSAARAYLTAVDNETLALSQKCPHLGCRVPYCQSSGRFECPCHGSKFTRAGQYVAGPAPRGMDRYPTKVGDDGLLYIDTGSKITGPAPGSGPVPEASGPACAAGGA